MWFPSSGHCGHGDLSEGLHRQPQRQIRHVRSRRQLDPGGDRVRILVLKKNPRNEQSLCWAHKIPILGLSFSKVIFRIDPMFILWLLIESHIGRLLAVFSNMSDAQNVRYPMVISGCCKQADFSENCDLSSRSMLVQ